MKKIYCLSGLGADQRIYQNLSLPGYEMVHLPWVAYDKHDEIPCYAQKMSATIKEENPILMGVSFGGMLSVEIAKLRPVEKIFIISSAKLTSELVGSNGGFMDFLIRNDLLPTGLMKIPNSVMFKRFGAHTDDETAMLKAILKDTDTHFVKWAMKALYYWRSTDYQHNLVHIHGTNDHIIPPTNIKPTHWIDGGTHIMVYNRAAEIAELLKQYL